MRIGLIAPPWVAVPPPAYGGTEAVVDNLARGLAALGHEVRLFTVGESTCPVDRQYLYDSPIEAMGAGEAEAAHVLAAYEELSDVDIIHDHTALGPLIAADRSRATPPVVTTAHGPFDATRLRTFATIAERTWQAAGPMASHSSISAWRQSASAVFRAASQVRKAAAALTLFLAWAV